MVKHRASRRMHRSYVRDARGRRVKQLDPVAIRLLRRNDVIEQDVVRAIIREEGVSLSWPERGALVLSIILFSVAFGMIGYQIFRGTLTSGHDPARFVWVLYCLIWPYIIWWFARRRRFAKTAAAMLKFIRCPHCGYDLRMLPIDPADGATLCPECGCAWQLDRTSAMGVPSHG